MVKAIGHRLAVIFAFSAILFGMSRGTASLAESHELPRVASTETISPSHSHSRHQSPLQEKGWWLSESEESRSEKETTDRTLPDFLHLCWEWFMWDQFPPNTFPLPNIRLDHGAPKVPLFLMLEVFRN
jgi:hypothetical protein